LSITTTNFQRECSSLGSGINPKMTKSSTPRNSQSNEYMMMMSTER